MNGRRLTNLRRCRKVSPLDPRPTVRYQRVGDRLLLAGLILPTLGGHTEKSNTCSGRAVGQDLEQLRRENAKLKVENEILKKAAVLCGRIEVKYEFIDRHRRSYDVERHHLPPDPRRLALSCDRAGSVLARGPSSAGP
jgi:hypothetical protein